MVSKRNLYDPLTRLESAITRLQQMIYNGPTREGLEEVLKRDLREAHSGLEYAYEMAD